MQKIFETIFDICYLSLATFVGLRMLYKENRNSQYFLFGIMAITLAGGDSFHLIPRMIALNTTGLGNYKFALGFGKLLTSITMTAFYVLLYEVWAKRYEFKSKNLTLLVYLLALLRIGLCIFPQNDWFNGSGPLSWRIYRNIPFLILGLVIIYLFYKMARQRGDYNFRFMYLTIILSFAFYIPVVLLEDIYPLIGFLMVPKTLAYVWTILIGYFSMNKENEDAKVLR